ncbi:MAG TPA: NAD-glutamate dehydrogenase [Acidimicrobiia bacterium]|nr:NAD-glutamate dehydrogenase [Acidimicrobiia bacterium]
MPSADGTRAALIDDVASRAEAASDPADAAAVGELVRRGLGQVTYDDLTQREPAYLASVALVLWKLARTRAPGSVAVEVFTPDRLHDGFESVHTIVLVASEDMPFVVESITMEIDRHGFGVHLVLHPQMAIPRDPDGRVAGLGDADGSDAPVESFVLAEIDRETDTAALAALRTDLVRVLGDVRAANRDWAAMADHMRAIAQQWATDPPPLPRRDVDEGAALLRWMVDDHFVFLGARDYDLVEHGGELVLRSVDDTGLGILRDAPPRARSFASLPPATRALAQERSLFVITKANARSTVHRRTHLDYFGVKRFGPGGDVIGEHRFLGLFTASVYSERPAEIPMLRQKVADVLARAGFLPDSHDERRLIATLDAYPRDELFQMSTDELFDISMGILRLQERRRVRLFVRRDPYDRFVTCLVYVPRDRYTTALRRRIERLLSDAFGALGSEWSAMVTESALARYQLTLHTDPRDRHDVDVEALEAAIAVAARGFVDELRDALVLAHGEEAGLGVLRDWSDAFSVTYSESVPARDAVADIRLIEQLVAGAPIAARLDESAGDGLLLTICGRGTAPTLSDVLPVLVNLGVTVVDEYPFTVRAPGLGEVWLKRLGLRIPDANARTEPLRRAFEETFLAVSAGAADDDGFNRLVLLAGLSWREVAVIRSYSRYLRQVRALYGQPYVEEALAAHAGIVRQLIELFVARFDPRGPHPESRDTTALEDTIATEIDEVANLDHDRILRALLDVIGATVRTNWFLPVDAEPERAFACKILPERVPGMPTPRPMFEIFVSSPRMEGVHVRGGRVARGGIRWSDRTEDFRTEVLGLMKAQMVKNTVIVPVGAKGGFVVRRPQPTRDDVTAAYRSFIAALLDLTDNIVDGAVVGPSGVVRHDDDDPYLVVAADKGTASFSDVANDVARARGFWLGDGFASGGSDGYDHKELGITARGAWESVRHHFRALGVDADRAELSVVGIGDMSGDVFGNGMLLSPHLRLVAAFDHRHVFLDPDPDPARSFAERSRLFALSTSSWDDYDRSAISKGGGVFDRRVKAIALTPEVRARLAIAEPIAEMTPADLIRAILRAPVDLLWNGGIGTFVKASTERHIDVGDKGNDVLRVDASELRCRVVAEGGNLGLSQLARVEFARGGGRINTDAIDNSAGVDLSDHEVNIKIALDRTVRDGALAPEARNDLLVEITDEVVALVLRDNYRQNRALTTARTQSADMIDVHARLIRDLERRRQLDRTLELLPDDKGLAERRSAGAGLSVPELAVLMAHAKIDLILQLLGTDLPDDADLDDELARYFPHAVRARCRNGIDTHPLRRDIVVNGLANGIVNRAGISVVFRLAEETGASPDAIVRAHHVARAVFDQDELWREIEGLDGIVAVATQTEMYLESRKLMERATRWFLHHRAQPLPIASTVERFRNRVARVVAVLPELLRGTEREWLDTAAADLAARGVPRALATRIALLESSYTALHIVDLADQRRDDVEDIAALHTLVGDRLRLDWLRDRIVELPRDDRWAALARLALREDTYAVHQELVAAALASAPSGHDPARAFEDWAKVHASGIERALATLRDIEGHAVYDLATLSVGLREVRDLAPSRS